MRKNRTLLVLLALALLAAPALAGRADVSANLITFDSAKAQLRITGPGGYLFERNVDGAYSFSLADKKGGTLADGTYSWELRPIAPAAKRGQSAPVALEAASGSFTVRNGSFVVPTSGGRQDAATKDIVHADDVIIQGSACVGFDCVNNESFGFDTIRLKENNTRIKFEDTSTGTFPSTDWQLTANDSASGGANRFSIEDITAGRVPFTIEGASTTNSLYVDSTGRVGFRTSTPVLDIHINTSNSPAIRLEQNSSGGFTAQTWDIAGNEANFFVRDVTSGSRLPFRIQPGASTNSIYIASDGDVGFGTTSPDTDAAVDIVRTANATTLLEIRNTNASTPNTGVRINNGAGEFGASTGLAWDFRENTVGQFVISQVNGQGSLLTIDDNTGAVTIAKDLNVTGTKNFAVPDPVNASQWLYFSALEGPEAGTYYRGTAKTTNGEAVIDLPDYFARLTEEKGMTVQLTPVGGYHQLYVASTSPEKLVVRANDAADGVEFYYMVQGIRTGYADFKVERPSPPQVD